MIRVGRRSNGLVLASTLAVTAALATSAYADDKPRKPAWKVAQAEPGAPQRDAKEPSSQLAPTPRTPITEEIPVYSPPRRGAPRSKVGGGLRGARALPEPLALAPEHVAQTASPHPSLFWYIDALPARGTLIIFTLIEADGMDPVVETALNLPRAPGIQRIRLEDHDIELRVGVEYEWSISLVVDPAQRSHDIVTTGYIERVAAQIAVEARADTASRQAAMGLWYDALESLSDSLQSEPHDAELKRRRKTLLRQAGLGTASNGE
jgi:hypothetical protein